MFYNINPCNGQVFFRHSDDECKKSIFENLIRLKFEELKLGELSRTTFLPIQNIFSPILLLLMPPLNWDKKLCKISC